MRVVYREAKPAQERSANKVDPVEPGLSQGQCTWEARLRLVLELGGVQEPRLDGRHPKEELGTRSSFHPGPLVDSLSPRSF